ncbi:MAG: aminotransferase class III-fold pyridoxal phosphate-dependent enzyme [Actinomycetota bacterium]|nr:aminotransferase class III-fold pyridoxal phosphate-dependent enzyme [Actinomycetota bacterium]
MPWSRQDRDSGPRITGASGGFLHDEDGGRLLDLASGFVCVSLGHGQPDVIDAICRQARRLCWAPSSAGNDVRDTYAQRLAAIAPWPEGARVHFGCGGGESNDDAVRIARQLTGRPKVLSAYRSYHGATVGAGGLTGVDRWRDPLPAPSGLVKFTAPFPYRSPFHTDDPATEAARALEHLRTIVSHEGAANIAAIVVEPVSGSSGLVVPPDGYLQGVRELCDETGILLVFDEVMTGFGRVGTPFAATRLGVAPDLLTFAKGASSSYVPLSGVLVREGLAARFDDRLFDVGHTHAGHVLAVAAGLAALDVYERDGLFERASEIERWLRVGLGELAARHPVVGDVRGLGALFALDLVADPETRAPLVAWHEPEPSAAMARFHAALRARGVHTYGRYHLVMVAPPLTISRDELAFGLDALDAALDGLDDVMA